MYNLNLTKVLRGNSVKKAFEIIGYMEKVGYYPEFGRYLQLDENGCVNPATPFNGWFASFIPLDKFFELEDVVDIDTRDLIEAQYTSNADNFPEAVRQAACKALKIDLELQSLLKEMAAEKAS